MMQITFVGILKLIDVIGLFVMLLGGCALVIYGAHLETTTKVGLGTMYVAFGIVAIALSTGIATLQMKFIKD